ncbi:hypothetical protein QCD70_06055 [Agreia sp. PsM10]|uniref:hypothetical protein n=1 Tax=Agreia sp. PsM10 TaxID=3030533 RepID=UPI00263AE793|nr:hypothetical protein [Agreia sp. PsM10]MDN4639797.1 hypothetical protein [Agreia sp. PsM10]
MGRADKISDAQIYAELFKREGIWRLARGTESPLDYYVHDLRPSNGEIDLAIEQRDGKRARLVVALPSSERPQYWLWRIPEDANDWVGQFLITCLDEEVYTGGLGQSRARTQRDGESYVSIVNYGWQVSDAERHRHLSLSAGPLGWYDGGMV